MGTLRAFPKIEDSLWFIWKGHQKETNRCWTPGLMESHSAMAAQTPSLPCLRQTPLTDPPGVEMLERLAWPLWRRSHFNQLYLQIATLCSCAGGQNRGTRIIMATDSEARLWHLKSAGLKKDSHERNRKVIPNCVPISALNIFSQVSC